MDNQINLYSTIYKFKDLLLYFLLRCTCLETIIYCVFRKYIKYTYIKEIIQDYVYVSM